MKHLHGSKLEIYIISLRLDSIEEFESTRYVKCLFCEDNKDCEDPMKGIDFAIEEIDRILGRMENDPHFDILNQEAESLRERIRTTGSNPLRCCSSYARRDSTTIATQQTCRQNNQ